MNVVNQIKELLGMDVKLAQMKLMDGVTVIEAETFEPEMAIFIVNEDERVPMPVGEYMLEDGNVLKVETEGVIASIEMPEEEAPEVEEEVETTKKEEEMATEVATPKKVVESVTKEMSAGIRKVAVKVVDIFGNDTTKIITHEVR
jgi:hypothetical protein